MNVLLLSMPDSFEHMPPVAIRMPNGALASLAGNVDGHHRVAIADLILVQSSVRATVERLVRDIEPDVVGLSVMTFQRRTALAIARLLRALSSAIANRRRRLRSEPRAERLRGLRRHRLHRPRRGRARRCASCCARSRTGDRSRRRIRGLSYRTPDGFVRNADRPVIPLASAAAPAARTAARACSSGYTLLGRRVDVVETSRGCTFDCSFCSIIEMRGRNFHPYPLDRVLADIADARRMARRRSFSSTTTSRSTSRDSRRCARPSSTPGSTTSTTSCRR